MSVDIYTEFIDKSGWRDRDGQRQMMLELGDWVRGSGASSIAIQAPTGTGKSVAALLTGIDSVRRGGGRIVIGTSTVILTDQYKQDIREVQRHFRDHTFAVLKGASNYLCRNNAEEALLRFSKGSARRVRMEKELGLYLRGQTEELPFWAQADTESCSECRSGGGERRPLSKCDYAQARQEALSADVVVTSHAMIQCDLKVRVDSGDERNILGKVVGIVFDEAHQLNRLLYSSSLTHKNILDMDSWGLLNRMGTRKEALVKHFDALEGIRQSCEETGLTESSEQYAWFNPSPATAQAVLDVFPRINELIGMQEMIKRWEVGGSKDSSMIRKARGLVESFVVAGDVLKQAAAGSVAGNKAFYLTTNQWDGFKYHIRNMQADGWFLRQLEKFRVAYISATLGTETHPTYVLESLGISGVRFVAVESAFDYSRQMEWTWVDSGPNSTAGVTGWLHSVVDGGTLALVSGHWSKNKLVEQLSAAGVKVFKQADTHVAAKNKTNTSTIEKFRSVGGVLVGTDAFATGLDLKRKALTKLLVDDVRAIREPVAYKSWKYRWLTEKGKSGREDYEIPERAIVLEQQIGRLIRTEEDLGCVVLLFDFKGERGLKQEIVLEAMKRFDGARWVEPAQLGTRWNR